MASKTRRLTVEKQQKVYQEWLKKDFPALFNEHFLPMPLGIFEQLSALRPDHISKTDLRITLGWYASRINYLQSIRKNRCRINLDGSEAAIISKEEKQTAAKKIQEMINSKKRLAQKE